MLIIVAVNTQQFPVASVGGIVVMVMVLVVDREFAKPLAFEFAPAAPTDRGEHLESPLSIASHSLFLLAPDFGNELTVSFGHFGRRHRKIDPPGGI
jgi:hypothetical protein